MKYLYEDAPSSILKNSKNKFVDFELTIAEVLEQIKNGTHKDLVNAARLHGKKENNVLYTAIKNIIPTWTPSANFNFAKEKCNIKELTGFYYLDIDEQDCTVEQLKQFDFIYAAWKSVSNLGYGIIIKCDNLTTNNYLPVWNEFNEIFKEKGLLLDSKAKGFSRQCVFSYDPDIYINRNATIYHIDHNNYIKGSKKNKKQIVNTPPEIALTDDEKLAILFNDVPWIPMKEKIVLRKTLNDYEGKDFIFKKEGIDCRNVWINKEIKVGNRNISLTNICTGLLYNNPDIDYEILLKYMITVNQNNCVIPLEVKEVNNIVNNLFEQHKKNELIIQTKKKYTFFDPSCSLTIKEKISIGAKNGAIVRKERRLAQLQFIYAELKTNYNNVTQQLLADNAECSIETVKRYWKDIIK